MTKEAAHNLANGIVEQAARDYMSAFMGLKVGDKRPEDALRELDEFFSSQWYVELTKINGQWLIEKAKIKALDEVIEAYEKYLSSDTHGQVKIFVPKSALNKQSFTYIVQPKLIAPFNEVIEEELKDLIKERDEIIHSMEGEQ